VIKKLFNISSSVYQVAIAFIGIVNIIFFFASGHSVNFEDIEQLKLFLSSILFLTTFLLLFAFRRTRDDAERKSLHKATTICLAASLFGLIYIVSELLKVKYGDNKPYLVFVTVFLGVLTNVFLLYVFLFRKEISLTKDVN
jgi:amino acid transporter